MYIGENKNLQGTLEGTYGKNFGRYVAQKNNNSAHKEGDLLKDRENCERTFETGTGWMAKCGR